MKKITVLLGVIVISFITILSSCSKNYIRNGNSKIIGTWKTVYESSDYNDVSNNVYTYSPNPNYKNYSEKSTRIYSKIYDGKKVTEKGSIVKVYSDTTISSKTDTTYSDDYGTIFTFNEDGTGLYSTFSNETDENGNPDIDSSTKSCHWSWIDSYKNKQGIIIRFNEDRKQSSGEIVLYIDTLDRNNLVFSFNSNEYGNREYTHKNGSYFDSETNKYVDIFKTTNITWTNTSNGEIKLTKEKKK